jgi:hypothetical protein
MKITPIAAAAIACACAMVLTACDGGLAAKRPLRQYASLAPATGDAGVAVRIRGKCYDACVAQLAAGNVYIDPDAVFSAYVSWPGYSAQERLTSAAYRMVPACARAVLDGRRSFAFDPLSRVYGSQILAACPDMKPLSAATG